MIFGDELSLSFFFALYDLPTSTCTTHKNRWRYGRLHWSRFQRFPSSWFLSLIPGTRSHFKKKLIEISPWQRVWLGEATGHVWNFWNWSRPGKAKTSEDNWGEVWMPSSSFCLSHLSLHYPPRLIRLASFRSYCVLLLPECGWKCFPCIGGTSNLYTLKFLAWALEVCSQVAGMWSTFKKRLVPGYGFVVVALVSRTGLTFRV